MREREAPSQYEPTPRFLYEGDVYPPTGQVVVRQDRAGYEEAYRTIARHSRNHPALLDRRLWPPEMFENTEGTK